MVNKEMREHFFFISNSKVNLFLLYLIFLGLLLQIKVCYINKRNSEVIL